MSASGSESAPVPSPRSRASVLRTVYLNSTTLKQFINHLVNPQPRPARRLGKEFAAQALGRIYFVIHLAPGAQLEFGGQGDGAQEAFGLVHGQGPEQVRDAEGDRGDVSVQAGSDEHVARGDDGDDVEDRIGVDALESPAGFFRQTPQEPVVAVTIAHWQEYDLGAGSSPVALQVFDEFLLADSRVTVALKTEDRALAVHPEL